VTPVDVTIPPGTVADTTIQPMVPVRVEARMAEPVIGLDTNPLHLDGPLSQAGWAEYLDVHGHGSLPPMTPDSCADFNLPLATWTAPAPSDGVHDLARAADRTLVWGWACSAADYQPAGATITQVRRRPATDVMARYTPDKTHHLSAGPLKARDVPQPAVLVETITWWALTPDPDRLHRMLNRVPGLGRLPRHGNGRVHQWTVNVDERAAQRWRWRTWPQPGGLPAGIRAPYHHPSRRMPCAPLGDPPWR
jgi:hypothetical protein